MDLGTLASTALPLVAVGGTALSFAALALLVPAVLLSFAALFAAPRRSAEGLTVREPLANVLMELAPSLDADAEQTFAVSLYDLRGSASERVVGVRFTRGVC